MLFVVVVTDIFGTDIVCLWDFVFAIDVILVGVDREVVMVAGSRIVEVELVLPTEIIVDVDVGMTVILVGRGVGTAGAVDTAGGITLKETEAPHSSSEVPTGQQPALVQYSPAEQYSTQVSPLI